MDGEAGNQDRVATDIAELKWNISRWMAEEESSSEAPDVGHESSPALRVYDKRQRYLKEYFELRQEFEENLEDLLEVAESTTNMDLIPGPSHTPLGPAKNASTLVRCPCFEDLLIELHRDSSPLPEEVTPGDSGEAVRLSPAVSQLTGLKKTFSVMFDEFISNLTEQQPMEMSELKDDVDVQHNLADMLLEVMRLVMETVIDILSQDQFTSTSCSGCETEAVVEKSPLDVFVEKFDITKDTVEQTLSCSLAEAFCELSTTETGARASPSFIEAIVTSISDEVSSVLLETIQASLEEAPCTVSHTSSCSPSCCYCTACKEILGLAIKVLKSEVSAIKTRQTNKTTQADKTTSHSDPGKTDDALEGAQTSNSSWRSRLRKFFQRKKNKANPIVMPSSAQTSGDEGPRTVHSIPIHLFAVKETPSFSQPHSTGWFPTACPGNEVPKTTTDTKERRSHQSSGSVACNKGKKTEQKEDAARRPSLLKRLRRFCGFRTTQVSPAQ